VSILQESLLFKKKVMKMRFLLIVIFTGIASVFAQSYSWTSKMVRENDYPLDQYYTGFVSLPVSNNVDIQQTLKELSNSAKTRLVESVQSTIKSQTVLNTSETNNDVYQYFRKTSTSYSKADIAGLKVETYYNKKNKMCYAFAYVKKADAVAYYKNIIEKNIVVIEKNIEIAEQYATTNKQEAIKTYLKCLTLFVNIEEAQTLLYIMGVKESDVLQIDKVTELNIKVNKAIEEIKQNKELTLDDACIFIASGLKQQTKDLNHTITIKTFTYQETGMGSPFSKRILNILENKMSTQGFSLNNSSETEDFILTGTYWEENNRMKIIAVLRDNDGNIVASASSYVPMDWFISNNIAYKPGNFNQAYSAMKVFRSNELANSDLQVEIWTNKGYDDLLYTEGDILRLFVQANRECYIRLVYYMADGSKVLLLDNYYIGNDKVNQVFELPQKFECAAPFGIEFLQLNAQTKKFAPLSTTEQYGYTFINDNVNDIVQYTRGFKLVNDETLKCEKRLMFTTVAKQ
jgi:hypothetical protein